MTLRPDRLDRPGPTRRDARLPRDVRPPRLTLPGILGLTLALTLALAASPAPTAAQGACGGYHTVDTGETLVGIAARCGVTLPALLAANPGVVDDEDFEVGSRLRVPEPGGPQPSAVQACGPSYTVRTGDTVEEIAVKCGLTIPLLVSANAPLPSPLGVHAGRVVRIPNVPRAAVLDPATVAAVRRLIADDAAAEAALIAMAADTAEAAAAEAPPELTRVEGVLESGPACMRVRDAAGEVTAIAGGLSNDFQPGDRVILMGVEPTSHECGSTPTLELRILYRAP